MSEFSLLRQEIQRGIEGRNNGIPMGFDRLNKYIGIRKKIYSCIFGATGSGKSAFVHSAYILSPFDYYYKNRDKVKLKIILFSMERSKIYTLAKWLSRKIFLDQGVIIPIQKMLGWWDVKLTSDETDLIDMFEDYMGELMEVVDVIENAHNPTAIYKYVKEYALNPINGREEEIDEYHKTYIPIHEDKIVIPIIDHMGLLKREKGMVSKKEAIDKGSDYMQYFRDHLGYTPVAVSQINRNISSAIYAKVDSFEPTLDDIKESGKIGEDCDTVISLFDPLRYKTIDPDSRYDVSKFQDMTTGAKYFRSLKILKNTYGEDSVSVRMGFQGVTGIFAELPKAADMEYFKYEELFDGRFFLPKY